MSDKRKSILLSEKIKIVIRAKNGESLHSLEADTGYQRCQIRKWVKNESLLLSSTSKKDKRIKGAGRKLMYPEIEEDVLSWFRRQRAKKLVVNYSTLRREAKRIAEVLIVIIETNFSLFLLIKIILFKNKRVKICLISGT